MIHSGFLPYSPYIRHTKTTHMAKVNPCLTFNGNCEEAFNFYKSVFGTEFRYIGKWKEMPPMPGFAVPADMMEKVMHVSLPVSEETVLMGSDANTQYGSVTVGQNMSILVSAETKEEADKIFKKLSAGGRVTMPLADSFWGAYFGMLIDKYSNIWLISYDYPPKD